MDKRNLYGGHHRRSVPKALIAASFMLVIAGAFTGALANDYMGVASVIDADTIEVHGQRIRLYGVDAPEGRQNCFTPKGDPWRCGQKGALALSDFLGSSTVSCLQLDTDRYGRAVAKCTAHGQDLGQWLVSSGWAMAYVKYSSDYIGAEERAKADRRGIWQGSVQPPWEWRKQH